MTDSKIALIWQNRIVWQTSVVHWIYIVVCRALYVVGLCRYTQRFPANSGNYVVISEENIAEYWSSESFLTGDVDGVTVAKEKQICYIYSPKVS